MFIDNSRPNGREISPTTSIFNEDLKQPQADQKTKSTEDRPINMKERWLLVRGALCLSALGVVAFLVTGQVAVVVAMNAPLLAIIGKEFFAK